MALDAKYPSTVDVFFSCSSVVAKGCLIGLELDHCESFLASQRSCVAVPFHFSFVETIWCNASATVVLCVCFSKKICIAQYKSIQHAETCTASFQTPTFGGGVTAVVYLVGQIARPWDFGHDSLSPVKHISRCNWVDTRTWIWSMQPPWSTGTFGSFHSTLESMATCYMYRVTGALRFSRVYDAFGPCLRVTRSYANSLVLMFFCQSAGSSFGSRGSQDFSHGRLQVSSVK